MYNFSLFYILAIKLKGKYIKYKIDFCYLFLFCFVENRELHKLPLCHVKGNLLLLLVKTLVQNGAKNEVLN